MILYKFVPIYLLALSFILAIAFAYGNDGNTFVSRPISSWNGTGLAILFLGYPLVYAYMRHLAITEHHMYHKKK